MSADRTRGICGAWHEPSLKWLDVALPAHRATTIPCQPAGDAHARTTAKRGDGPKQDLVDHPPTPSCRALSHGDL
jgi:hypothetical protein